ncbi:putative glycosyl transferase [Aggregatibacter actinomycetemcomitans]|uniref:Glycosyltransferase n=2 Tax=Aggregatibacter actinomycetemcomitans TaxID=714 RepID=O66258_AGGAC|nr:glycosyltransferase family 2 protein [Aggregatibacter actinomycetemcomitans]ACX83064.1 glycosyl transferase [Aggregatibacter actinomycetemcomitans D11S-1]KOE57972.1 glycosyl transferase [Aggregatibacter actinomycetemcomitans serotype c str. AAS4A]KOE60512.1 glycosyl transferase [Aggregatibacter actinomycetemcomitans serotype c str. D17P-2]KOE60661.1 glycosyl transferase [Aggregatibacter actinomycetemcomitans serotype c str. SCC2302]MCE3056568.1 glycosyltransferase family 2 protein [Aggregat
MLNNFKYDLIVCTLNGASFISAQLKSILTQSILPQKIIVSDDGSTDGTLDVVQQTFLEANFTDYEIVQGPKKGVIANFLSALAYSSADFTFLADQDDIWHHKKAVTFSKMAQTQSPDVPTLTFSDARLIDEYNQEITSSFFVYQALTADCLVDDSILYKNCVQGAACMINRALRNLALDSLPYINLSELYMHDWWLALLARYYGNTQFIDLPLLDYRQHSRNQVGVFNYKWRLFRFHAYWKNFQQAIRQVKMFEQFVKQYGKPHNLLIRSKRQYLSVPKLKRVLLLLFAK